MQNSTLTSEIPERRIPERIIRLEELANNLWWSWHPQARALFRALDYSLWRTSGHNPVKQLREISAYNLQAAGRDPDFLTLYDSVMAAFDAEVSTRDTWFTTQYPGALSGPIAYFSAEFAIHNSLPIYAGGLGILAGDICKEACDLGLPLVSVGFMYPRGYFHQHISASGWQEEMHDELDFDTAPVSRIFCEGTCKSLAQIQLDDRTVHVGMWQVRLGHCNLHLLDTNIEENAPQDRGLSSQLYIADWEQRIQQEILLGIGGTRVLRALGIRPALWHINEGHTAFMMLERIREEVEGGATFAQALKTVQATTMFTTHTPVPAGHDVFPPGLVEKYFHGYWSSLGIDKKTFLRLGQRDGSDDEGFNMTILALRTAGRCNAVSKLHGMVTRRMWHVLWPKLPEPEVPISHITNGIHVPTWIAPEMGRLYDKYLGPDWVSRHDDPSLWQQVFDIPAEELWAVRQTLKTKLCDTMFERARARWAQDQVTADQVLTMGALLEPSALTIGFVRRFTEYKRPTLILQDLERLKKILTNLSRPVQIIFAGKSHPADVPSKCLLQHVYNLSKDRRFQGRIAFVEDYDMHIARYLVHGVDLWLNTPRRLQEASGTSGMKAALNGVPHLSIRDGWWHEAYNGHNGWVIGSGPTFPAPADDDRADAGALYRLLEKEIIPLYYERDREGVPHGWVHLIKETIRSIVPQFSARRMLKEYAEQMYLPAIRSLGGQG